MPVDDECPHGLIPGTCSLCKHPYRPPAPDHVVYTLTAKHAGACPACHGSIIVGDIIAHLMPSDIWVCLDCAQV
jgi:hypothetical protein